MARSLLNWRPALSVLLRTHARRPSARTPTIRPARSDLNWSTYRQMRFTFDEIEGAARPRAEGVIDEDVAGAARGGAQSNTPVDEIWLRSPGGDARAGNEAGQLIRKAGIPTRIPPGWACFSACNFMFMGGPIRFVDDGGLFVVHMFTHLGDKDAMHAEISQGADSALGLIGDVEQDSAMLASEDNDFLIRMGVSRKLLTEVMYKQKAVAGAERQVDAALPDRQRKR